MLEADTLRGVSALLSALAFGGLVHRCVAPGPLVRALLARLVTGLFAALWLVVALGTWRRAQLGGPFNEAQWGIMALAAATVVVCLFWHRLAAWRHVPPE